MVQEGSQRHSYPGEFELLSKYQTPNQLAEALYNEDGKLVIDLHTKHFYVHHLYEDINFYLGDFLEKCPAEQIKAVVCTETLSDDMQRHFNITVKRHDKKNEGMSKELSQKALDNLYLFLQEDFKCIERLHEIGVLSMSQLTALSGTLAG